jgi:hypothetical protein
VGNEPLARHLRETRRYSLTPNDKRLPISVANGECADAHGIPRGASLFPDPRFLVDAPSVPGLRRADCGHAATGILQCGFRAGMVHLVRASRIPADFAHRIENEASKLALAAARSRHRILVQRAHADANGVRAVRRIFSEGYALIRAAIEPAKRGQEPSNNPNSALLSVSVRFNL